MGEVVNLIAYVVCSRYVHDVGGNSHNLDREARATSRHPVCMTVIPF